MPARETLSCMQIYKEITNENAAAEYQGAAIKDGSMRKTMDEY